MTKVAVFGASGIVGQHMILSKPESIKAEFIRYGDALDHWKSLSLTDFDAVDRYLDSFAPDVIVNLAGENRVDVVEKNPEAYKRINIELPRHLAETGITLIQGSTQGVFGGDKAPYAAEDSPKPITQYGHQKSVAEACVLTHLNSTVVRLTFVLGVRPFPEVGRRNPLEDMIEKPYQLQVNDRWFSPLMATDAADLLWDLVGKPFLPSVIHLGEPVRVNRFTLATDLKYNMHGALDHLQIGPVSHNFFEGIAPRPFDTTWAYGSRYNTDYVTGMVESYAKTLNKD